MSDQRNDLPEDGTLDSEAAVEALLGKAEPRPVPPAGDEVTIRSAVHAEWSLLTGRRQRRRRMLGYGIAASVLVLIFAGLTSLRAPGEPDIGLPVATIQKQLGVVRLSGGGSASPGTSDEAIVTGQTVETGEGSGLALNWGRGGSLRIDANSRVHVVSASKVELIAGRLYYDSALDTVSGVSPQPGITKILIDTPQGVLRHIGTQFLVAVTPGELQLLVREGAVRLALQAGDEIAAAGQQLNVTGKDVQYLEIDSAGDQWHWVENMAPAVDLEGRSAFDALAWVGRETGKKIVYGSAAAERAAKMAVLRLGQREPSQALSPILEIAGLEAHNDGDRVVVTLPGARGA